MPEPYVSPFNSFWIGGFECTDKLNSSGNRVDFINITHHLTRLDDDYRNLAGVGIKTVREGLRWSQVEKQPYQYDFSVLRIMLAAGKRFGIQQIWDICHFGYPDDLSPLHPHFTNRFVALCIAFTDFFKKEYPSEQLIVTPINEVSFISWLGGEVAGTSPYCTGNGWNVKYALMRAYIQGIRAMKDICPEILILTTEPLVNMVPPLIATEIEIEQAATTHLEQYQALDMLTGNICPELGGAPDLVDLIGFNFYYNNQWIAGTSQFLPWLNEEDDPRWKPLSRLVSEAYLRYNKPVMLSETSHPGEDRPKWMKFIGEQCQQILEEDIPLLGVCLYPIIDRPDWDNLSNWHSSGLWDEIFDGTGGSARVLNTEYAAAFAGARMALEESFRKQEQPVEDQMD